MMTMLMMMVVIEKTKSNNDPNHVANQSLDTNSVLKTISAITAGPLLSPSLLPLRHEDQACGRLRYYMA